MLSFIILFFFGGNGAYSYTPHERSNDLCFSPEVYEPIVRHRARLRFLAILHESEKTVSRAS